MSIKRVISSKTCVFKVFLKHTILGRKGENIMQISYQLMEFIRNKENEKKDLMEIADMSANCIANMGKGEFISLRNIGKICFS